MSGRGQKMYYCKFCEKYVQDKQVTRQQHESCSSHKRNMQKYLEKEKKNEIMKEREESRTLKELKKMEDAAVGQMQMDIMHGAIVEKKIRRDERLREDITHHKELRKERNQEENASRSYLFQYNTKQTKKKPQQPIQYVEPIPSEPQKENDEGIIGDWCYVDDPYVKVNSEDIDESTN